MSALSTASGSSSFLSSRSSPSSMNNRPSATTSSVISSASPVCDYALVVEAGSNGAYCLVGSGVHQTTLIWERNPALRGRIKPDVSREWSTIGAANPVVHAPAGDVPPGAAFEVLFHVSRFKHVLRMDWWYIPNWTTLHAEPDGSCPDLREAARRSVGASGAHGHPRRRHRGTASVWQDDACPPHRR